MNKVIRLRVPALSFMRYGTRPFTPNRSTKSSSVGSHFTPADPASRDAVRFRRSQTSRQPVLNDQCSGFLPDLIEQALLSLEKGEPYKSGRFSILCQLPYLCRVRGKSLQDRFVQVVDIWWARVWTGVKNGQKPGKPTSMVFHLGNYNRIYDGVIIRKLGIGSIETLLDLASGFDFCSLPERDDLLSYMAGVRDLVLDPVEERVAQPSLKLTKPAFCKNLKKYLREKSISRKLFHDRNPNDEDDDWIFMIIEESIRILFFLRVMEVDLSILRRSGDEFLILLCDLSKRGFDYWNENARRLAIERVRFCRALRAYAQACVFWRLDPDELSPDSWRSWYACYKTYLTAKIEASSSNHQPTIDDLNYLTDMSWITSAFRKIDYFAPLMDHWLADVQEQFHAFAKITPDERGCTPSEFAICFTGAVFAFGQLSRYFASIGRRDLVARLEPTLSLISAHVLDYTDPRSLSILRLTRYLTGLRGFLLSTPSRPDYRYSKYDAKFCEFNDKVVSYLNRYCDEKLAGIERGEADDMLACDISNLMFLLTRLRLPAGDKLSDKKLLTSLTTLFERGFVGRGDRLFRLERQALSLTLVSFGVSSCCYRNFFADYRVDKEILREYFSVSKRFLESSEPRRIVKSRKGNIGEFSIAENDRPNSDFFELPIRQFASLLYTLPHLARQFSRFDDFESLKSIWERRVDQLADSVDSRDAYRIWEGIENLRSRGVQFDRKLTERMLRRGMEWINVQKLKQERLPKPKDF